MAATGLVFELLLILALILINGIFAMSEIAVVSSRKPRLAERAEAGDTRAARALDLAQHPTRFLSTVQVGITLVGVLAGAYGGARVAGRVAGYLERFPTIAPWREEIALALVVGGITYVSLVLGELLPKRVALHHPERIAAAIAGPMQALAVVATPLVKLLTASTELMVRVLGVRKSVEPPVTEAEVSALLDVGTAAGVFEEEEHDLVERVFWLGDRRVTALMTPRHRIEWLDIRDPADEHRNRLIRSRFSHYLVCDGEVDRVLGVVRVKDLLASLLEGRELDLRAALRKPIFVPESLGALRLLEVFRETGSSIAVVVDEYGGVEGLVTLNDILEEIAGSLDGDSEQRVVRREDGSWLVDGSLAMDEFWEAIGLEERRSEARHDYHTIGGLVMTHLGRIPRTGDRFTTFGLDFEVVDMDGHRVDRVLVSPPSGR
ncbi:MAG TPA: hemolysin family protein [Longimicrobiales bacterium]|nr:hemolysin family protein [Longimicrobiales bacterium]